MSAHPLRLAAVAGVAGGLLAALVSVAPALVVPGAEGRFGQYAAILVVLLAVQLGMRAAGGPEVGFWARLVTASLIATLASLIEGVALYVLYARLRPEILTTRYERYEAELWSSGLSPERLAKGLAALATRRAQYLDPLYQAVEGAGLVLFCGLLLGAYLAFRTRVAARLADDPLRD